MRAFLVSFMVDIILQEVEIQYQQILAEKLKNNSKPAKNHYQILLLFRFSKTSNEL
jgi:hypothetical protein